jgi:uncharacterized protein (TIGR03067 family)
MRRIVVTLGVVAVLGSAIQVSAQELKQTSAKAPSVAPEGAPAPEGESKAKAIQTPLDGIWVARSCQVGGKEQLGAPAEREAIILSIVDGQHKLYFLTDPEKMEGKRIATAKLTVNEKEKTFELQLVDGLNQKREMHGIYDVTETSLKLSYGPKSDPRPKGFTSPQDSTHFCEEWARYTKKK